MSRRRVEAGAACQRVRQLRTVDDAHRADGGRRARRLPGEKHPRDGDAAQHADDAADENEVDERETPRFTDRQLISSLAAELQTACRRKPWNEALCNQ